MRMASVSASLQSLQLAVFVSLCRLRGCLKVGIGLIVLACAFCVFCVRLALMMASRWVVTAPLWYVASCAFIGIVSQGPARPCISYLSVSPWTKAEPVVGFADGRKKMGVSGRVSGGNAVPGGPFLC